MHKYLLHCTTHVKNLLQRTISGRSPGRGRTGLLRFLRGNNDGEGNPSPTRLSTSALPVNRAFCHGLKLSVAERTKLLESAGKLVQLPLPRQFGRLVPGWLLTAKVRQRRFPVHRRD